MSIDPNAFIQILQDENKSLKRELRALQHEMRKSARKQVHAEDKIEQQQTTIDRLTEENADLLTTGEYYKTEHARLSAIVERLPDIRLQLIGILGWMRGVDVMPSGCNDLASIIDELKAAEEAAKEAEG